MWQAESAAMNEVSDAYADEASSGWNVESASRAERRILAANKVMCRAHSFNACKRVGDSLYEGEYLSNAKKPEELTLAPDRPESVYYYDKACELPDALVRPHEAEDRLRTCHSLARVYRFGTAEIPADASKAHKFYALSCLMGHKEACSDYASYIFREAESDYEYYLAENDYFRDFDGQYPLFPTEEIFGLYNQALAFSVEACRQDDAKGCARAGLIANYGIAAGSFDEAIFNKRACVLGYDGYLLDCDKID